MTIKDSLQRTQNRIAEIEEKQKDMNFKKLKKNEEYAKLQADIKKVQDEITALTFEGTDEYAELLELEVIEKYLLAELEPEKGENEE